MSISDDSDYVPSDSDESDDNLATVDEIYENLPKGRCPNSPAVSKMRYSSSIRSSKSEEPSTDVTNSDALRVQGINDGTSHIEPVTPEHLEAQVGDESNTLLPIPSANQMSCAHDKPPIPLNVMNCDEICAQVSKGDSLLCDQPANQISSGNDESLIPPNAANYDELCIHSEDESLFFDPTLNQLSCDELCDKIMEVVQGVDDFSKNESAGNAAAQALVENNNNIMFSSDPQSVITSVLSPQEREISAHVDMSEVLQHNILEQQERQPQENNNAHDDTLEPLLGDHSLPSQTSENTSRMSNRESTLEEGESSAEKNRRDHNSMRDLAKKSRMRGEAYTGFRRGNKGSTKIIFQDVERPPRAMQPPCTSKKCQAVKTRMCDKITQDEREALFHSFWKSLKSWDEKKMFVCSTVDVHFPQRKTTNDVSRRQYSIHYFLKIKARRVPVCKKMYLGTLGLKKSEVSYWIKNYVENNHPRANNEQPNNNEFDLDDGVDVAGNRNDNNEENHAGDNDEAEFNGHLRGNSRRARKHKVGFLKKFLNEFPKLPSHYCRMSTSKQYLQTDIRSVTEFYKIYQQKCRECNEEPLGQTWFEKVYKSMNLGIFSPRKDMCDLCYSHKAGNLDDESYHQHLAKKDRARSEKERDKAEALASKCHVISCDLMAVQMVPLIRASAAYYKLKLTVHNFTVYDLKTRDSLNYWFDETGTTLCASTFASFIVDYVSILIDKSKLPVIIYSDGCTYQNRNAILANALLHLSVHKQTLITQKFLEKGHTQFECDSVHSAIERKFSKVDVYLPSQFCQYTARARENPHPYRSQYVDFSFFKDYSQESSMAYPSIRPGKRPGEPTVTDLRVINYLPDGTITYRLNFDDEDQPMPRRTRKKIEPCSSFPDLHKNRLPIPYDKWQDLQSLKNMIPSDCHSFFDNIPHTGVNQSIRAQKRKMKPSQKQKSNKKKKVTRDKTVQ